MSKRYFIAVKDNRAVDGIKIPEEECYLKTSIEEGPFRSIKDVLDHCDREGYFFTVRGTRELARETVTGITTQALRILHDFD